MRLTFILSAMLALTVFSSCSKDDDKIIGNGQCYADKITFVKTAEEISSNNIFLTFDAKNTSSRNYDIANGDKLVNLKIIVKTTDGASYETNTVFTETKLSAGATVSTLTTANFGTGKTYASYTMTTSCD
jgi:hypothetical protein